MSSADIIKPYEGHTRVGAARIAGGPMVWSALPQRGRGAGGEGSAVQTATRRQAEPQRPLPCPSPKGRGEKQMRGDVRDRPTVCSPLPKGEGKSKCGTTFVTARWFAPLSRNAGEGPGERAQRFKQRPVGKQSLNALSPAPLPAGEGKSKCGATLTARLPAPRARPARLSAGRRRSRLRGGGSGRAGGASRRRPGCGWGRLRSRRRRCR